MGARDGATGGLGEAMGQRGEWAEGARVGARGESEIRMN